MFVQCGAFVPATSPDADTPPARSLTTEPHSPTIYARSGIGE